MDNLYPWFRNHYHTYPGHNYTILENLVPDIDGGNGGIVKLHPRNGRTIFVPSVDTTSPRQIQKVRDSSLFVHGAKLFNVLPKEIRNCTNCSILEFKAKLDDYISQIPDEPVVPGYSSNHSTNSNSLLILIPDFERDQLCPWYWLLSATNWCFHT